MQHESAPDSFGAIGLSLNAPPQTARVNLIVLISSAYGLNRPLWKVVSPPNLYFWCRLGILEGTSLKNPSQGDLEGVEGLDWGPSKPALRGKAFRKPFRVRL